MAAVEDPPPSPARASLLVSNRRRALLRELWADWGTARDGGGWLFMSVAAAAMIDLW